MKFWKRDEGSMVIEATLIAPFFLSFMMVMIAFVQIAVVDMALQSSVSETTKQVAAHMYPIYLLSQTDIGKDQQAIASRVWGAKQQFASLDTFAEDYAALIPDPLIQLLGWHQVVDDVIDEGINRIVLTFLKRYVDERIIDKNNLTVIDATLPNLHDKQQASFGLTAEYKLRLAIPFFRKHITLRKTAYERVWVGD